MSDILDLRQSSRAIAAHNERMASRYRDDPDRIDVDRHNQQSLADRSTGWLAELLHLASNATPFRGITTLEIHLTTNALTVTFAISNGFIERLLRRVDAAESPAPDASLALLLQVGRPQLHSSQGSVLFTPMPPPDVQPTWLVTKTFGPVCFARPIDGFTPAVTQDDRADIANLFLSMADTAAANVANEVHGFGLEYLGLIDGEVDLTFVDDTTSRTTCIRKRRDADGRYWVGNGETREHPLAVHRSQNGQLVWSVLEHPATGGRLCSYLPTGSGTTIPGLLHAPWQLDASGAIPRTLDHELHLVGLASLVRKVANTRHGKRMLAELDVTEPTNSWADRLLRQHVGPIQQDDDLQPIFDKMRTRSFDLDR